LAERPDRPYSITVVVPADREIFSARRWWRSHRLGAPDALDDEFSRALGLLARHPEIGALTTSVRAAHTRRIVLPRSRYVLYYRVVPAAMRIEILAFWHTSRRPIGRR
jgi:plasmid stabilization system protein ParE